MHRTLQVLDKSETAPSSHTELMMHMSGGDKYRDRCGAWGRPHGVTSGRGPGCRGAGSVQSSHKA